MLNIVNGMIWTIFLPVMIIICIMVIILFIKKVEISNEMKENKQKLVNNLGSLSISLGAMIGTGAIIGVLGSILSLRSNGQIYFEAICGWTIIGMLVLLPLVYIETFVTKIKHMSPKEYIGVFLNKKMMLIYSFGFVVLHVFGFGGFQILGIGNIIVIISNNIMGTDINRFQEYFYVVFWVQLFVSLIILTRKHEVFLNAIKFFIFSAIIIYVMFAVAFIFNTSDYISIFISNVIQGMKNPITSLIGIPIGMFLAFQRIVQSAEPGLGSFALSSLENDTEVLSSSLNSLLGAIITIFISIFITTYITSYGVYSEIITLDGNTTSYSLLEGYVLTGKYVTGIFGVFSISIFTLFSGITTLLGGYYFLEKLFDYKESTNIKIFLVMLYASGLIAIFGNTLIFDFVDFFLFIVLAINVLALLMILLKKDAIDKK